MAQYGAHIQAKASLTSTGSGSIVIFASESGTRWSLTKGAITVYGAGVGAYISLYEVIDASAAATILNIPCVTNEMGYMGIDLGEHGWSASQSGSRLNAAVEGANASVNMIFVGYRR